MKKGAYSGDRGATIVFVASAMLMLMGFAAIAVDLGMGFNERRQDQTAADMGVMAGALETLGSSEVIRDLVLDFTARNLDSGVIAQADWEACVDAERVTLNSTNFNFIPVPSPSDWSISHVDCISIDPAGYVRVNLPTQSVETTFGRALGVDELNTGANAIARIRGRAGGGLLPFGLLASAGDGDHLCLRDNSGGQAQPPCDGPDTGNFGGIESPQFGNQELGTTQLCNGSKNELIAINIALGIDHRVVPHPDGDPANDVEDTCAHINAGLTPNSLETFQGLAQGFPQGLATGGNPLPESMTPRLKNTPNATLSVRGHQLDNRPLWDYIIPSLDAGDIPADCVRSTFDNDAHSDEDWDGDGEEDRPESWQHMHSCLEDYGSSGPVMFDESIGQSPRFAYTPQFWEDEWPPGNSDFRRIRRFRATWLQGTWWGAGNNPDVFHPGESGPIGGGGGNPQLRQLSGFVVPDASLPEGLRGDPPASGGLNPFKPELYR